MSSDSFTFKRFTIHHDKCSMKVGTDGVLLGCWAKSNHPVHVLDVGTGSGLIALMIAQRYPEASIEAIDIDQASIEQAIENVKNSPFHDRIEVKHLNFNEITSEKAVFSQKFDMIVSNPPFYEEETKSATTQKNDAKHTSSLSFENLIKGSSLLLNEEGEFCVIIPFSASQSFISIAAINGLYLTRRCDIRNSSKKPFKRSLLSFRKSISATENATLNIRTPENEYTEDYKELTKEFYL